MALLVHLAWFLVFLDFLLLSSLSSFIVFSYPRMSGVVDSTRSWSIDKNPSRNHRIFSFSGYSLDELEAGAEEVFDPRCFQSVLDSVDLELIQTQFWVPAGYLKVLVLVAESTSPHLVGLVSMRSPSRPIWGSPFNPFFVCLFHFFGHGLEFDRAELMAIHLRPYSYLLSRWSSTNNLALSGLLHLQEASY